MKNLSELNALVGGVMSDIEKKSWEPVEDEMLEVIITYHRGARTYSFSLKKVRLSEQCPYGIDENEIAEIRRSLPKTKWTMVARRVKATSQRIV